MSRTEMGLHETLTNYSHVPAPIVYPYPCMINIENESMQIMAMLLLSTNLVYASLLSFILRTSAPPFACDSFLLVHENPKDCVY